LIDLYSDTATRPSVAMLAAMTSASVGDEQKGEDPSVNALEEMGADLLGKDAAVFLPSATMANQIAVKVHTQPGDEAIVEQSSHIVTSEGGGPAFLSGIMLHTLCGSRGTFTPEQVEAAIRPDGPHHPRTRLVCVEQTSNRGGGSVWPLNRLAAIAELAKRRKLATHMDGSRLMNAAVASGVGAREYARGYDSVTLCLSKGLGCPIGALLAGGSDFIRQARRYKHLFGGAMRQAGFIAAAGIYALVNNVSRLTEDHTNAKLLARLLANIPGIDIDVGGVETNIVFFDIGGTSVVGLDFIARLRLLGVRMGLSSSSTVLRAVTHLDVSRADVERAASATAAALKPAT
jgi:threonine aldolase